MTRSLLAALLVCAAYVPALAHNMTPPDGKPIGVDVQPVARGEMLVLAKRRSEILDLGYRAPIGDLTFRRLLDFISLQHFVCFGGLFPGSLADQDSPFNACSHAEYAGVRALLDQMALTPGIAREAGALKSGIEAEVAGNPVYAAICSNDEMRFNTGWIVRPEWRLVPRHVPTLLAIASVLFVIGVMGAGVRRLMR